MPRLVAAHLIASLIYLSVGVGMGIYMGVSQDFTLGPVHAHVNLLGWVTNALFGTIFWHVATPPGRLGWSVFTTFNLGVILKNVGLAVLLSGGRVPILMLGGILFICAGIVLFAGFVVRAALRPQI